ncbi:hypothetical protein GUJ93_ZPchr0005g15087 [Zizania palustris]|uniref:Uncharacterized protein n=1 Tax=Zizania palustris TaxID=103762 RepID=A0A8J5S3F0_ZIZPA|nr:hypothetical protein GUJ93_ZPchr0005g15087 [Zizania palustris]
MGELPVLSLVCVGGSDGCGYKEEGLGGSHKEVLEGVDTNKTVIQEEITEQGLGGEVIHSDENVGVDTVDMGKKLRGTGRGLKKKRPPVAVRQSARIRRDGVPISVKAQQRADQKNDISGGSECAVEECISLLKAKELAQAQLCMAKVRHKEDSKKIEESERIGKGSTEDVEVNREVGSEPNGSKGVMDHIDNESCILEC